MQLLYRTAKGLGYSGSTDGLYDPATNIDLGTMLLGQLRQRWGDDFRRVYSAYNSGNPDLWETSKQVATNVGRAVDNLTKWLSLEVSQFAAAPASGPLVGLLVLIFLWSWTGKRR
jgi:soluble lytic murein transglycosylase-like protein